MEKLENGLLTEIVFSETKKSHHSNTNMFIDLLKI